MSIQELRVRTGAGMVACVNALKEASGDVEAAILLLRKQGLTRSDHYASRQTKEGAVGFYIHHDFKMGVMVCLNCETDFVARTPEFRELATQVAMTAAAGTNVRYISQENIPQQIVATELELAEVDLVKRGLSGVKLANAAKAKASKSLGEQCLLDQVLLGGKEGVSDTVDTALKLFSAKCGEKVTITALQRVKV